MAGKSIPMHSKFTDIPVYSASFAATFSANPTLEFRPVPTAVPPLENTKYIMRQNEG